MARFSRPGLATLRVSSGRSSSRVLHPSYRRPQGTYASPSRLGLGFLALAVFFAIADLLGMANHEIDIKAANLLAITVLISLAVSSICFKRDYLVLLFLAFLGIHIVTLTMPASGPLRGGVLPYFGEIVASLVLAILMMVMRARTVDVSLFRLRLGSLGLAGVAIIGFFLYPKLDYISPDLLPFLFLWGVCFALVFLSDTPLRIASMIAGSHFVLSLCAVYPLLQESLWAYVPTTLVERIPLIEQSMLYCLSLSLFLAIITRVHR